MREDIIKMDIKEAGRERLHWIHLAQDRVQRRNVREQK
jgi:hypothetical protein